jgi:hypothetical protein
VEEETTGGLDYWLDELGELLLALLALPKQTSRVLEQVETGAIAVQIPQVSRDMRGLIRSVDRLTAGVVFAAALISGIMSVNAGNVLLGQGLLSFAGLLFLWILFGNSEK